jgi:hypothetical protein
MPLARALLDGVRGGNWGSVGRAALWSMRADCVPPGAPVRGAWDDLRIAFPVEWDATDGEWFMASFLRGFGALAQVERTPIAQRGLGVTIGRANDGERELTFAIDFFDEPRLDTEVAAEVDLYFKLQYQREGYGLDHVVPGGYVEPRREPHDQFCRLRSWGASHPGARVYGRFGTSYGQGPRALAVGLLEGRPALGYSGGMGTVPYVQSLEEAASADVCVDLPGRGPFCHRLVDYLAVGACIVAFPHASRLREPLEDRRHLVYTNEDMSDLPDLCEWLLDEPDERARLGREAASYFDRNLHYLPLAAAYLDEISRRLAPTAVAGR